MADAGAGARAPRTCCATRTWSCSPRRPCGRCSRTSGWTPGRGAVEPMLREPARPRQRLGGPPHGRATRASRSAAGGATSPTSWLPPAPRRSGRRWRPSGTSRRERRDGPRRRLGGAAAGQRRSHLGVPPVPARPAAARAATSVLVDRLEPDMCRDRAGAPSDVEGSWNVALPGRGDGALRARRPLGACCTTAAGRCSG